MPKSEAEIRTSLEAAIEDVERHQQLVGSFAGSLGTVARATKDLVDVVENRFEQVDRRFDRLDKEIGLLQDSVRTIDARIETLVGYIIREERKDRATPD